MMLLYKRLIICLVMVSVRTVIAGVSLPIDRTLFGTKTAYGWVRDPTMFTDNEDLTIMYQGRTCTAIHVNMLLRHGSRWPSADDMTDIQILAKKIADNKGPAGMLDFLDRWQIPLTPSQGDQLAPLGWQEMNGLGRRTGERFKQLLMNNINRVEFTSSTVQRTIDSGNEFQNGLAYTLNIPPSPIMPALNNSLLRVYDTCPYYDKVVADNHALFKEVEDFVASPTYQQMLHGVENRLRMRNGATLTDEDAEYIWEMCAFEMYVGRENTWCQILNDEDRKIVNYAKDLRDYRKRSYGNRVSGEVHCVVVQKLFQLMDDAKNGQMSGRFNFPVGSFMFTHSSALQGTLTALKLFKDAVPPRASNMKAMENRQFKTSMISPMSGNLGFALYACPGNTGNMADTTFAVKLFFNERAIKIPQCNGEICNYDMLKHAFKNALQCDVKYLCSSLRNNAVVNGSLMGVVTSLLLFILTV